MNSQNLTRARRLSSQEKFAEGDALLFPSPILLLSPLKCHAKQRQQEERREYTKYLLLFHFFHANLFLLPVPVILNPPFSPARGRRFHSFLAWVLLLLLQLLLRPLFFLCLHLAVRSVGKTLPSSCRGRRGGRSLEGRLSDARAGLLLSLGWVGRKG